MKKVYGVFLCGSDFAKQHEILNPKDFVSHTTMHEGIKEAIWRTEIGGYLYEVWSGIEFADEAGKLRLILIHQVSITIKL